MVTELKQAIISLTCVARWNIVAREAIAAEPRQSREKRAALRCQNFTSHANNPASYAGYYFIIFGFTLMRRQVLTFKMMLPERDTAPLILLGLRSLPAAITLSIYAKIKVSMFALRTVFL